MNQITIDASITRETLVGLITGGGIAHLELLLELSPPETTIKLYELNGLVSCQASNNNGGWRLDLALVDHELWVRSRGGTRRGEEDDDSDELN